MNDNLIGNELVACKVCGSFNTSFSKHCVKCGNDLREEVKEPVVEKKKRNIVKILIIVFLSISIILGITFLVLNLI